MRSLGKGLRDCCDLAGQVSRQHRDVGGEIWNLMPAGMTPFCCR
jgi:hypothetical protein